MKTIFKYIGLVIKGIWKLITFIRLTLTNLIFLGFIALILFSLNKTDEVTERTIEPSALVLDLSGPIVEKTTRVGALDSVGSSLLDQDLPQENLLFDIVDTIRYAKNDDSVTGIVLALGNMSETGLNKLRYIAKALNEFKTTGKPVFAVGDFYGQSQYYLASYADKIFLSPQGGVLLKGYSAQPLYYRRLLDKLDITTHVFRVGTYKSAVEPFLRDDMSPQTKQANLNWLNQLWDTYLEDISSNREIDPNSLRINETEFLQRFAQADGNLATLASQLGLVDKLASRPAIREELANIFGNDHQGGYKHIRYHDYLAQIPAQSQSSTNEIAVIVASGAIMDGHQPANRVGGDDIAAQLRQARTDRKIRAVVLRVDSPGGSAFASEVIRNEIEALKAVNKPVVISMSSLAASGGYWIAMSGSKIIASPTTLTGSIGIFSVIPTFEKAIDKLGISTDGVGTAPFATDGIASGLSQQAQQAMQMGINNGYKTFISLVAENRSMSLLDVDKIAQGRVWTGSDALANGLVDQLGDFDNAIEQAASLAELDDYQLQWLEEPLPMFEQVLEQLLSEAHAATGWDVSTLLPEPIRKMSVQMKADMSLLSQFNDPKGEYAFCLNCQVE